MEDGLKITTRSLWLVTLLATTSCSWLERMERSLVGEEDSPRSKSNNHNRKVVSKAEYDELLARYEELNRQYLALKEGRVSDPIVSDLKNTAMIENGQRVETVDVFASSKVAPSTSFEPADLESQLQGLRQAHGLKATQPAEAMKLFQALAAQGTVAVRARAQNGIGEVLQSQGEYDLALQAYETVITRLASSGAVLDALRGAVLCADKLGVTQKKDQYLSLLKDVFQVGA